MAVAGTGLRLGQGVALCRALRSGIVAALLATAAALLPATSASAACTQVGSIVTCTGTTLNFDAGTQTGLNVTVQSGATVLGVYPSDAIRIENPSGVTGNTLTNNGTIDGFVTILSVNPGTDVFTNNGVLQITDANAPLQQHSMSSATFIQTAIGTLKLRVDANGFADGILTFDATLAGRLVVVVQPGLYTTPMTYSGIIFPLNSLTGNFDSVTTSSPFFTASVVGCGCVLDLTLTRVAFNSVPGMTPNQQKVGNALEAAYAAGTPTGNAATFFSNLFAATSIGVYDQLSGEGTSAAQDASFAAGAQFNNAMFQQGLAWLNGVAGAANSITLGYAQEPRSRMAGHDAFAAMRPRASEPGRWRAWALGFGATRTAKGASSTGSADKTTHTYGGAFGVDRQLADDLLVGVAAGGTGSGFSVSSLSTSGDVDGGHVGVYAVKSFGASYLAATLNYARLDNRTERTITGSGPTETANGRFNSDQLGGRLEFGRRYRFERTTVTPFAAIEPSVLWQQPYAETSTVSGGGNGILGLSYAANTTTSLPLFLGAQVDTRHRLRNGAILSPSLRAAWVHEFKPERQIEATFVTVPSASFTVDGARAARDAGRLDAGATLALNRSVALFATLSGELSNTSRMASATGGATMSW